MQINKILSRDNILLSKFKLISRCEFKMMPILKYMSESFDIKPV